MSALAPLACAADLRVAVAHDWLTGMRGGERVLEAICELLPQAEIFTLLHVPGSVSATIERHPIRTSLLQRVPFAARTYRYWLPLFPALVEQFDLDRFDLVVSSSHCAAKAVVAPGRARHLCYCHSPMRYAWDQFEAYFGEARVGRAGAAALRIMMRRLRRWDAATSARVDRFVANSRHVAGRIRRYYNRDAGVVYPPVDTAFFRPDGRPPGGYFLVVSALVPYKRLDLAIAACRALRAPLKIVGRGPERARLERMAGPEVEFLGARTNEEVRELYRGAAAVVLPGEEDFGIVPVEALACGRPVVALARGGARETVEDGVTGVLVEEASAEAFADALARVRRLAVDPQLCAARAARFSRERFAQAFGAELQRLLDAPEARRRW
ncbi:MAG TPA: glycosyltransferase [Vicinamibacterales bacterium]|nr:glycosyltransferase [Vicinamibacterales bacterium]